MTIDTATTPFLRGLMAPVTEERHDVDLAVQGELPPGLRGLFVRNGPNPQFAPPGAYHPFDGDGMVHGIELADGTASYRNRWIESAGLLAERRVGHALYGGLSEFSLPDPEIVAEAGIVKNTGNTHTVRHAGRLFALMEAGRPTEITRALETVGEHDYDGRLVGPMTAHPKVDPVSGELVFFSYNPFPPHLRYHVVDRDGSLVHSVELDLPAPVMMHDFVVTEHYSVFLDAPAIFDVKALMAGESPMRWEPDNGTRLGVLPRFGGADDIRWFEVDDAYVVHFANAWEDGDTIEVRGPRFARSPFGFASEDRTDDGPQAWRWTIDLAAGTVRSGQTDDRMGEFPRVNDDRATRPTRYLYHSLIRSREAEFDFHGVVRYDLDQDRTDPHLYGPTEVSGEHVFAPDPDGRHEDDGWLLTIVTDRATEHSELVVLDARDVAAGPVARVQLRARVPLGFHANWFADA